MLKKINKNIWLLSIISFLNDMASEMLYPILPVYLKSIGFTIILIGVLDGLSEAISSLAKGFFGHLSDKTMQHTSFIRIGYFLSSISKPLLAISKFIPWVFICRISDRLGKGIRTSPRDALLNFYAGENEKASIFGFHRAWDTLGAFFGPILALFIMQFINSQYKYLFYIAFIPGAISVLFTFLIKDIKIDKSKKSRDFKLFLFVKYFFKSKKEYKLLLSALIFFSFFSCSTVFLLLILKEKQYSDNYLIYAYLFFNLIYAIFSFPIGIFADKIGIKKVLVASFVCYFLTFIIMAYQNSLFYIILSFFLYGIYYASSESTIKALISHIIKKEEVASAIGTYEAFKGISLIFAGGIMGFFWNFISPKFSFIFTSFISLITAMFFLFFYKITYYSKYNK